MEELNNKLEGTIEVIEPVEVLEETVETMENLTSNKNLAVGAVIITGLIVGGYGIKKLWDKRKSKKATSEVILEETEILVEEEPQEIE